MKIYKMPQLAEMSPSGEYCLGPGEVNTGSVYLLYGRLRPKEAERKVAAVSGVEEIIYVLKGRIRVRQGKAAFQVASGEAFHSKDPFLMDNLSDYEAVYLRAGGSAGRIAAEAAPTVQSAQSAPSAHSAQSNSQAAEGVAPQAPPPETAKEAEFEIFREADLKEGEQ